MSYVLLFIWFVGVCIFGYMTGVYLNSNNCKEIHVLNARLRKGSSASDITNFIAIFLLVALTFYDVSFIGRIFLYALVFYYTHIFVERDSKKYKRPHVESADFLLYQKIPKYVERLILSEIGTYIFIYIYIMCAGIWITLL